MVLCYCFYFLHISSHAKQMRLLCSRNTTLREKLLSELNRSLSTQNINTALCCIIIVIIIIVVVVINGEAPKSTMEFSLYRIILIPVLYELFALLKHLDMFYYHSNNFFKEFFRKGVNFEPVNQQNKWSYRKQHKSVQHSPVNLLVNARHGGNLPHRVIWAASKVTANLFFDMPQQIPRAEAIPA